MTHPKYTSRPNVYCKNGSLDGAATHGGYGWKAAAVTAASYVTAPAVHSALPMKSDPDVIANAFFIFSSLT